MQDTLINRDLKHSWHPFTQMKDHETVPPLLITHTKDCYLYDSTGKAYLDTISSWWCNIHGHNHPRITAALATQAATLSHTLYAGITHPPVIQLTEALMAITPETLNRVFYTDNGSTAVETALKCALGYFKRLNQPEKTQFIGLEQGYHGDTLGCMAVSQVSAFNAEFSSQYTTAYAIPVPETPEDIPRCVGILADYLDQHHTRVAALIVEPLLQAAGGFRVYSPDFLSQIRAVCQSYNILFIVDEVATGFGRTGRYFASDYCSDLAPDFMCLSKGLTNGTLPFAATLMTEAIYEAFYSDQKSDFFAHGHTYCANPLGCAIALETIQIMADDDRLNHASRVLAPQVATDIAALAMKDGVCNPRTLGTIGAVDVPGLHAHHLPYRQAGLDAGLLLRPLGDTIYFMPPLCISEKVYSQAIQTVGQILDSLLTRIRSA